MGQVLSQPIQSQLLQRRGNDLYKCGSAEMHGFRMAMEDCHTIAPSLSDKFPQVGLFAVFDGHAGQKAAVFLEAELHKRIAALEDPTDEQQLSQCVQKLDADFLTQPTERDDGSTCTFCVIHPVEGGYEIIAVNVGDSRSILLKEDGTVEGLTVDHKPEDPEEDHRIRTAGGTVSMNRVDGQLAMSRAIGDWQYKSNPEIKPELQKVIAVPEIKKTIAKKGDRLIICCDGIVEQMTSEEAAACAYEHLKAQPEDQDLAMISYELNKYSLKRGSKDNHSCMVISFEDGNSYARDDQFIAGPYHPYARDSNFKDAYLKDAKKHGYEGEKLFEMARATEAKMPELANTSPAPADDGEEGGSLSGLQALQALINQPGDVGEKLMMLSSMLNPGAKGEDDDNAAP